MIAERLEIGQHHPEAQIGGGAELRTQKARHAVDRRIGCRDAAGEGPDGQAEGAQLRMIEDQHVQFIVMHDLAGANFPQRHRILGADPAG